MVINFTVTDQLYILIFIIPMRKYYTLVKNGRQEGGGAGNHEVPVLLPAFETDMRSSSEQQQDGDMLVFIFVIVSTP